MSQGCERQAKKKKKKEKSSSLHVKSQQRDGENRAAAAAFKSMHNQHQQIDSTLQNGAHHPVE